MPEVSGERAALLLASKSPRRRELLDQMGVNYALISAPVAEVPAPGEAPLVYNRRVAVAKAKAGWSAGGQTMPTLGADTEVIIDGQVLGKPSDAAQAAEMLDRLAGRTHQVVSAVSVLRSDGQMQCEQQVSEVTFDALTPAQIHGYASCGEPLGKAGAYAIQGRAAVFISHLAGSYSGVMGLPLFETARLLAWANVATALTKATR